MIDLYYWPTPNGHKITMFLEETGLEYRIVPVNIGTGAQFEPAFLANAPNAAPLAVFESGAILLYLAEKSAQLLPHELHARFGVLQWLFWQMAGLGPMAGQNHHFNRYAPEKIPYAITRYTNETNRLYGVLDQRLAGRPYVGGAHYSIADIACYPWIVPHEAQGQKLEDFPYLKRWFEAIRARPATVRAYALAPSISTQTTMSEEAKKILFGQTARTLR